MMTATGHDSVLIVPTNGAVVPSRLWTRLRRVFAVTDFEREAEILYLLEDDDKNLFRQYPLLVLVVGCRRRYYMQHWHRLVAFVQWFPYYYTSEF